MKAILQTTYGDPEQVLIPGELDVPTPGEDGVLVRVHATSVNTPDCIATLGVPYVLRPLVVGLTRPISAVRGSDVAGVVEAVGPRVVDFARGDEVFGSVWTAGGFARGAHGAFCEYTVAPASQLTKKPARTSFAEAAGAVMSGVTSLQALRDVAEVRAGARVLINGASGGLGTFAVQIAKAMGAEVTGVCSTRNVELVRSLGADHVIDYTREDYTKGDARYDVVFDNVMNHPPSASTSILAPGGRFIPNSIGDDRWVGTLPRMVHGGLFKPKGWKTVDYRPLRENLEALAELLGSGKVRVVIDRVYPLEQAGSAVAHMASRRARGKVAIQVGEPASGAPA
ncbi:MAG: NAD(P)-dependent alcohol dehydrogenase [Myxococcota bacterium]